MNERKIEFRGKRIDTEEWVYGYYFIDSRRVKIDYYIRLLDSSETVEIIPETIEQYTGLKDKNGIKIFEGDICQIDLGDCDEVMVRGQIIWQFLGWVWDYYQNDECLSEFESQEIEIVNNIHDNPEFLNNNEKLS